MHVMFHWNNAKHIQQFAIFNNWNNKAKKLNCLKQIPVTSTAPKHCQTKAAERLSVCYVMNYPCLSSSCWGAHRPQVQPSDRDRHSITLTSSGSCPRSLRNTRSQTASRGHCVCRCTSETAITGPVHHFVTFHISHPWCICYFWLVL